MRLLPRHLAEPAGREGAERPANLLPNDTTQRLLQRLSLARYVMAQRIIDQRLIVPAAGLVDLTPEPGNRLRIQPEGRVLVVVYRWRGERVRVISARTATARERRHYRD